MKQPKKLTLEQKKMLQKEGEYWKDWKLLSEDNLTYVFINMRTKRRKVMLR